MFGLVSRYGALAAMICLSAPAMAAEAQTAPPLPAGDASPMMVIDTPTFLEAVASANAFEIRSSEIAVKKARDAPVKSFAALMISDHERAGEKLKALVEETKRTLPEGLSSKHARMISQLEAADAGAFDGLYVDLQTQAHMEAVALFRTYAGSGEDRVIVGFAKETLPVLVSHEQHVKALASGG